MEKSQLIVRPVYAAKVRATVVTAIFLFGMVVLFIAFADSWRFRHVLVPGLDIKNLRMTPGPDNPAFWGGVGEAIAAYIALATLGAVIASAGFVILQLGGQQQTIKTQYQPVVTCAALLYYVINGVNSDSKIEIAAPELKLRFRNLGDSPATFIDVSIERLELISEGEKHSLDKFLKNKQLHHDHLAPWKPEANVLGEEEEITILKELDDKVLDDDEKVLRDKVLSLIDGILGNGPQLPESSKPRLELWLAIRHRNVMDLSYDRRGLFSWSTGLADPNQSERVQVEYISDIQEARSQRSVSIGHFIRHTLPLQATVVPARTILGFTVPRWLQRGS